MEEVWFLTDEFGFKSFKKYYKQRDDYTGYVRDMYEVRGFTTDRFSSMDNNLLSRMRNLFVGALNSNAKLPKLIVVILDNDLINFALFKKEATPPLHFNKIIHWMMTELDRSIKTRKVAKQGQEGHFSSLDLGRTPNKLQLQGQ